jgi:ABC transporter substrate binding protein
MNAGFKCFATDSGVASPTSVNLRPSWKIAVAWQTARDATHTIPIVMLAIDFDPIARGYIAGLPRPGGNITGLFFQQLELTGKRLELLKDALPRLARVAVFWDAFSADQRPAAEAAARDLGVHLQPVALRQPPYDYASACRAAAEGALDKHLCNFPGGVSIALIYWL